MGFNYENDLTQTSTIKHEYFSGSRNLPELQYHFWTLIVVASSALSILLPRLKHSKLFAITAGLNMANKIIVYDIIIIMNCILTGTSINIILMNKLDVELRGVYSRVPTNSTLSLSIADNEEEGIGTLEYRIPLDNLYLFYL